MESCPSWPKEHDWKSCKRVLTCFKGSNPLLSVLKLWPVGQVVKTPPFHGGNMGSNPVRVTYGGLAQLGERLPYKQRVGGSSPSASTMNKRETDSNLINKAEPFFLHLLSSDS